MIHLKNPPARAAQSLLLALVTAFTSVSLCHGQEDSGKIHWNFSSLMSADTSVAAARINSVVAGFSEQDVREAPGTVMIITSEEIEASGARDLSEVLMTIPGLAFGLDVDDVIGMGIRGLWAHEGKCRFMLNGIPLNEHDFGTFALGQRIPLFNISRIEIMNGPGSVVYGGTAALGVINIITNEDSGEDECTLHSTASFSGNKFSQQLIGVSGSNKVGKKTHLSYSASSGIGLKSTSTIGRPDGSVISYGDSTQIFTQNAHFSLSRKDLRLQFLVNDYTFQPSMEPHTVNMKLLSADAGYRCRINQKTIWEINGNYMYQLPWLCINTLNDGYMATNDLSQRISFSNQLSYRLFKNLEWTTGIKFYHQKGEILSTRPGHVYSINNSRKLYLNDVAVHSEMNLDSRLGMFTLGGRLENNSLSGTLFAPRVCLALHKDEFHYKILFSRAFKMPTVQNVNLGPVDVALKPEIIHAAEAEVGYDLNGIMSINFIVFNTEIFDPIVYVQDEFDTENYINREYCGTQGLEARIALTFREVTIKSAYSFYKPIKNSSLPEVEMPGAMANAYRGLSAHKYTITATCRSWNFMTIHSQLIGQHPVSEYDVESASGEITYLKKYRALLLLNMNVNVHPEKWKRVQLRFGCNNILNRLNYILSPYDNDIEPFPMSGIEFITGIKIDLAG